MTNEAVVEQEEEAVPNFDFDEDFQAKVAALFARDSIFAMKVNDMIRPEYFTSRATGEVVRIVQDYLKVYKSVPGNKAVYGQVLRDELAAKRIRGEMLVEVKDTILDLFTQDISNQSYVTDKVATFARRMAVEEAIMKSVPLLERAEFDKIDQILKQAMRVGVVQSSETYDYFEEIGNRTQRRIDKINGKIVTDGITSGHTLIDNHLYHRGWGRKELSCIMGPAKSGKTLSLGEFAKNASMAGHNVLYDSLEVSVPIIAERIDAGLTNTLMRDLHTNYAAIEADVRRIQTTSGLFKMRDYPSGTMRPSALVRQLEEFRADGIIIDMAVVDYADIMAAEYRSDNLIDNLRSIYIDLRAIAADFNIALLTATQTNRNGAKANTAQATDIGDDWNKARTVDILIGLSANDQEIAAGEARLTWLLSRNTEANFTIKIQQDRSRMQFVTKILGRI